MRPPWRTLRHGFCMTLLCCGHASAQTSSNLTDEWPVVPGVDCSISRPCTEVRLEHWDRPTCIARIHARRRQEPFFSERYESSDKYFRRLPNGSLANTTGAMDLTIEGCETFCGRGTWYWDAVPRLTTWIIPVVLLLANIELSPIDKHRFMTVVHAVGDPIDSFWSLLHKIYVWRRLHAMGMHRSGPRGETHNWYSFALARWGKRRKRWRRLWKRFCLRWSLPTWLGADMGKRLGIRRGKRTAHGTQDDGGRPGDGDGAIGSAVEPDDDESESESEKPHDRARVIATVLAGFEEISGAYIETELRYTMILNQLGDIGQPGLESPKAWQQWHHCARMLADARTNEFLRTLLAIFIYVFGVAAALNESIGGANTSKPGGRIGSAVFLMWLVPLALFSNVVGTFTSRRTCLTIMRLFVQNARAALEEERREQAGLGPPAKEGPESLTMPTPAIVAGLSATVVGEGGLQNSPADASGTSPIHGAVTPADLLLSPSRARASPSPHGRSVRSKSGGNLPVAFENSSGAVELRPRSNSSRGRRRRPSYSPGNHLTVDTTGPSNYAASVSGDSSPAGLSPGARLQEAKSGHASSSRMPLLESQPPNFADFHFPATNSPGRRHDSRGQQHLPTRRRAATRLMPIDSWAEYFNSLHWLGAVYTYRPWKLGYRAVHRKSAAHYAPNWLLYTLAVFPIAISAVGCFIIMWFAVPVGWSCRHIWVVSLTVAWLLSNLFTIWLHNDKIAAREVHDNTVPWIPGAPAPSPHPPSTPLGIGSSRNSSSHSPAAVSSHDTSSNHPHHEVTSTTTHSYMPALTALREARRDGRNGTLRRLLASARQHILGRGTWSERRRWYVLLLKDGLVGLGGLAAIFLSTSGVFNNCFCWSAYQWHRWLPGNWGREAYVPLVTEDEYGLRANTVYGPVVWGALAAQLTFFFGIVFLWWDGISVVRWNESRRRREWRHGLLTGDDGGDVVHDDASYLLFWYDEDEFAAERVAHRRRRSTFASPRSQQGGSTAGQQAGWTAPSTSSRLRSRSLLARKPQERTPTIRLERGE